MRTKSLIRRGLHAALAAAVVTGLGGLASAREIEKEAGHVFEVGSFRVEWAPSHNGQSTVDRENDWVLFQYLDKPAETVAATIGVFRLEVPAPERARPRTKLGADYAIADVARAQQALFKQKTPLALTSKRGEPVNAGEFFSYAEPVDVAGNRASRTRFVRAWVYFPRSYSEQGTIDRVIGREQSKFLEWRPDQLERAREIMAGIRER